jgi:poly-gamma-glutamate capsule biosynthesis protein CapA/YwtB (metallophosphatase superfamily)
MSTLKRNAPYPLAIGILVSLCFLTFSSPASKGQEASHQQRTPEEQRALAISMPDGFTLASVGDLILAHPESMNTDPSFRGAVKIIKDADVAFGNFESTAIDIQQFKGYPQAEYGGMWLISTTEVPRDLREMGFDIVSRANNHATDWGIEGMRETDRSLDKAGLVHAGTGEHMAAARAARYLDSPKGRVAIVSMASSYTPLSRAMAPLGEAPGRPGLNALRLSRYVLAPPEMLSVLRKFRDAQPPGSFFPPEKETENEIEVLGIKYRGAAKTGFAFEMDPGDLREITKNIRQGKENSDFMIATIHAHEPGNWSEEPADFLPKLAHASIDSGADVFIGHGPHQLRGIEIYNGKPIFYSLGNFFFEISLQEPVAADMYEQFKADPKVKTDPEFNEDWRKKYFKNDEIWYQSVIAVSQYAKGQVSEIRLYPVDLGATARDANRGVPRLASAKVAQVILERLQRLSHPYGTVIEIEQSVGVIRRRNV